MSVRGVMISRHVDVAQLDHAFDHFAGVFLEQPFALPFADDRADFLFERFFRGCAGLRPDMRSQQATIACAAHTEERARRATQIA